MKVVILVVVLIVTLAVGLWVTDKVLSHDPKDLPRYGMGG